MSTATRTLSVLITGDPSNFERAINSAVANLARLGSVSQRYGSQLATAIGSGTASAAASIERFAVSSNANLANFYARQDANQRAMGAGWKRLGDDITKVGQRMSVGVTLPLALLGGQAFKTYAQIDALKLGLESIEGSAAGAGRRFTELREVARLPGLGLDTAVQGDTRLRAVGFSAIESKNALLQFGNALALTGGGKTELGNIITQLTQLGSRSRVLSEDLKPILTASPVVAKAVKDMFGSVDSEQISAKLEAAGRGPQQFITDLVAKLSEIERVKGGPKNAIENLGDALKIAQYNFGAAADKAFGLTNIITKLGDLSTAAADRFSFLPQSMQRFILVTGGVVAAAGPLAVAFGGLLAIIPSIIAGWKALTATFTLSLGPIGLITAAIGGVIAIAAILGTSVEHYSEGLGKAADKAKILASVNDLVSAAIANEQTKLQSLLGVARDETISKEARRQAIRDINAISPEYLGNLSLETINTVQATKAINQYTYALTQKAKLQALSQQLANAQIDADRAAAKSAKEYVDRSRFSRDQIAINIKTVASFTPEADQDRLFEELGKKRKEAELSRLKGAVSILDTEVKKAYADAVKNGVAVDPPKLKAFDYSNVSLGGSEYQKAKDRLKELKDQIASGRIEGKDVSAQVIEYNQLKTTVDNATESFGKHKDVHEAIGSQLTTNERLLKQFSLQLREAGGSAPTWLTERVALLTDAVEKEKLLLNFKPVDLGNNAKPIETKSPFGSQEHFTYLDKIKGTMLDRKGGIGNLSTQVGFTPIIQQILEANEQVKNAYATLRATIKNAARDTAADMANGIGQVVGGIMTGQAGAFGSIIKLGFDFLAQYLQKIAQANIVAGMAMMAMGAASANPFLIVQGKQKVTAGTGLQIAAGAVGVLGSAAASAIKLEKGGLATGSTLANIGESAIARKGGGEWVTSVDKGGQLIAKNLVKMGLFESRQSRSLSGEYPGAMSGISSANPGTVDQNSIGDRIAKTVNDAIVVSLAGLEWKLRGEDMYLSQSRYLKNKGNG